MVTLHIKNMVCPRCKMVVTQELEKLGLHPEKVELGEVQLKEKLSKEKQKEVDEALLAVGFERIDDRKVRLIESIKNKIIQMIHTTDRIDLKVKWSTLLGEELNHDYGYISNLFSSMEGITLEQYIIRQKIERVKELLLYDELNLNEIANRLGYSSVAHLSGQFKKVTGLTPTELKKSRALDISRKSIDSVS